MAPVPSLKIINISIFLNSTLLILYLLFCCHIPSDLLKNFVGLFGQCLLLPVMFEKFFNSFKVYFVISNN